jgi:hypothetical protein
MSLLLSSPLVSFRTYALFLLLLERYTSSTLSQVNSHKLQAAAFRDRYRIKSNEQERWKQELSVIKVPF